MRNIKEFGQLIANQRKKIGLTQEAFATRLNITPQAVSKWETGTGYPDITLIAEIAEILNIPIGEMFSDKNIDPKFPSEYLSLPFIFSKRNLACYSSKEVAELDYENGVVTFTDGSYANIEENTVHNKGIGEIRFYEYDDQDIYTGTDVPQSIDEILKPFTSLNVSISCACDVKVLIAKDGIPRITASGNPRYISVLSYNVEGDTLTVKDKSTNTSSNSSDDNKIVIYTPFADGKSLKCSINGCASNSIEPDFEDVLASINGSGDIKGQNCKTFVGKINGSGVIIFKNVETTAQLSINGSGFINIDKARDSIVRINGSGDIKVEETYSSDININGSGDVTSKILGGDLSAKVLGSGDIKVSGKATKLFCNLHGIGASLSGKELSVENADITLFEQAKLHIGAITGESTEKVKPGATLVVDARGK